ncbi:hypothetical protein NDN01_13105 [Sphingomonas sp. QA11]|uniref:hypothetical protein n=1 Tax=Sphingomonas sp. QA11 TaxID=2950605 RepID=UPI002349624D|nr:hypothetical protein [Sphingomonas sp. QA11]WCM25026.1 hypothetical protein NDN01_13105 [Sphingomonas sp. QA11]
MAADSRSRLDPALYPVGTLENAGGTAVSWGAILAGTVAATALTLTLFTLGSAFGLAAVSPWPGAGVKPTTFTIGAGIWLIVTQWLSSMLGGYMAGRLRTRWIGVHTDEVFFRDTAHGFMTWALATVIIALVALAATSITSLAAPVPEVEITKEAADAARKIAATFAGFVGISLVVGAFVASVGGAVGGRLRDLHP